MFKNRRRTSVALEEVREEVGKLTDGMIQLAEKVVLLAKCVSAIATIAQETHTVVMFTLNHDEFDAEMEKAREDLRQKMTEDLKKFMERRGNDCN